MVTMDHKVDQMKKNMNYIQTEKWISQTKTYFRHLLHEGPALNAIWDFFFCIFLLQKLLISILYREVFIFKFP